MLENLLNPNNSSFLFQQFYSVPQLINSRYLLHDLHYIQDNAIVIILNFLFF